MIDDELIFAYVDGELDEAERLRVAAAIAADPALQALVDEHRAFGARLDNAFSPILQAPVPVGISGLLAAGGDVVSLADARARRFPPGLAHWAALAATLVAGIVGGVMFGGGRAGPVVERDGRLVASGPVELALNTQLASTQSAGAAVRIGLTFRDHVGAICRSFSGAVADGVACRDGQQWLLRGLLAHEPAGRGDYRMAASSDTAELVDGLIAGDALDQAQERAASAADWAAAKAR